MEQPTVIAAAVYSPTPEEFPMYANYQPDTLNKEDVVEAEIIQLWEVHQMYDKSIKSDVTKKVAVANTLGQLLFHMKAALATPGRNGKWSAWLKERGIARASADRWVARFAEAFHLNGELTREATQPEPTEPQLCHFVARISDKCEKTLTTARSRYLFLKLLSRRLRIEPDSQFGSFTLYDPEFPRPVVPAPEPDSETADSEIVDVL